MELFSQIEDISHPEKNLSLAERIVRVEVSLSYLTESGKSIELSLKEMKESLYGGVSCSGIDTVLNEIQGQLKRMEISLQELEDDFEGKLFELLWKGFCRQLSEIVKGHAVEVVVGGVGVLAALFKLLFH